MNSNRTLSALAHMAPTALRALAVLLLIAMPVASQAPQADKSFSGTLTKVDAAKKVITVKGTGAEPEMTFIYDDKTQVTGAEKNVEGPTGKTPCHAQGDVPRKGSRPDRDENRGFRS
jgi:hypothetical protein